MPWNFTPATGSTPDLKIAEKIANEAAA